MQRLLIYFLMPVLTACALGPDNLKISHSTDLEKRNIKHIAILPLEAPLSRQDTKVPYSVPVAEEGVVSQQEAGSILTHLLYSTMAGLPKWQLVSEREVKEIEATGRLPSDLRARARRLGELVYADAVLFGVIQRFRERVGEDLGVKSPASVAFSLYLMDPKRGDIVWSAHFDETQRPLSENIFAIGQFTQRGARWLKAEELSLDGIKKAVSQLHKVLYSAT